MFGAFNLPVVLYLLSAVNLSSDCEDKLKIYRENFEKAYLEATESFYRTKAPEYMALNGVQEYMKYADAKLKEEEQRATRYLETRKDCKSVEVVSILGDFITISIMIITPIIMLTKGNAFGRIVYVTI